MGGFSGNLLSFIYKCGNILYFFYLSNPESILIYTYTIYIFISLHLYICILAPSYATMKDNGTHLYPNEQVSEKVTKYAFEHSTKLPEYITKHHAWGSDQPKAGFMISPFQTQFQIWFAKALGAKRSKYARPIYPVVIQYNLAHPIPWIDSLRPTNPMNCHSLDVSRGPDFGVDIPISQFYSLKNNSANLYQFSR